MKKNIIFLLIVGCFFSSASVKGMEAANLDDESTEEISSVEDAHSFALLFWGAQIKGTVHKHIEDTLVIKPLGKYFNDNANSTDTFFGVFDGHGSLEQNDDVSQCLASNLPFAILTKLGKEKNMSDVPETITTCIEQIDSYASLFPHQGSTAVFGITLGNRLFIGNVGDSRAIIFCKDEETQSIHSTRDHKPDDEEEAQRISGTDGVVICYRGCPRLNGTLAISRAIGDWPKMPGLISTPDVLTFELNPSFKFIILMSDGLCDVMSNEEIVEQVNDLLAAQKGPREIASSLIESAVSLGSADDISVIAVVFKWKNGASCAAL